MIRYAQSSCSTRGLLSHVGHVQARSVIGRHSDAVIRGEIRNKKIIMVARVGGAVKAARCMVQQCGHGGIRSTGMTKAIRMEFDECMIPHPAKVEYGGEDAYFVSTVDGGACGVSDGVGGWQDSGVNPAEYSQTLMEYAKEALTQGMDSMADEKDGVSDEFSNSEDVSNELIDDSGAMYVAEGESVFKIKVMEGDYIVMGTDGLWDNLPVEKVVEMLPDDGSVEGCAKKLADAAYEVSQDPNYESPYALEARKSATGVSMWDKLTSIKISLDEGVTFGALTGGKLDDITVVVGHVMNE
eukprot:jgi/Picsp_1/4062/NSC_01573-R1_protein phosphatase 2c 26